MCGWLLGWGWGLMLMLLLPRDHASRSLLPDWQQMMERARGSTLLWLSPTTPHRKSDPSFVINLLLLLPWYIRILHQEEEETYDFSPYYKQSALEK
jgi:hypothetical protein